MILTLVLGLLITVQATLPPPPAPQDEPLTPPAVQYPVEAKKARIEGTVQLEVTVDQAGHVTAVQALSGPIALRQAAVDAYTHAAYRPLMKDGRPTPAVIHTSVNFRLQELPPDNDLLVDRNFEPLHARCQQLSAELEASRKSPLRKEAIATCRDAVAVSRRFGPATQLEARATALNDLVLLLIAPGKGSRQLPEAGVLANEAVTLIAGASPHVPAIAVAHITRAEVRSLAGDLQGAGQDCIAAEEVFTTLLADEHENERAGGYRGQLRQTLLLHAIVLERDHHPLQARRLRERASTI